MSTFKILLILSAFFLGTAFLSCNRKPSSQQEQSKKSEPDTLHEHLARYKSTYVHIDSVITYRDGNQLRINGGFSLLEDTLISELSVSQPNSNELLYEANSAFVENRFMWASDTLVVTEFAFFPVYADDFKLVRMATKELIFTSEDQKIFAATRFVAPTPVIPHDTLESVLSGFEQFKQTWTTIADDIGAPYPSEEATEVIMESFHFITPLYACALTGDKRAIEAFNSLPKYSKLDAGYAEEYADDAATLAFVLRGK